MLYVFHWFLGKHKVSAQEILEVIFELNQSKSGTPVGQSERVSNHDHKEDQTALKPGKIIWSAQNMKGNTNSKMLFILRHLTNL